MLSGERLLIVEEESLIALDIQRVLEDAHARETFFARNFKEVEALGEAMTGYDLAIVNPPRARTADMATAGKLVAAGIPVVVCSAFRPDLAGTVLETAECVDKPFRDEDLLEACRRALAQRHQP